MPQDQSMALLLVGAQSARYLRLYRAGAGALVVTEFFAKP
jgi:hypothetical protein